jgi:ubiquinone biosynthesis protein
MGDIVRSLKIADALPFLKRIIPKKHSRPISDFTRWEDIRMAIEELGPAFVKLGQMLSNRSDVLPQGLIDELAKLQDEVPPFSGDIAVELIERELNRPITDLFESFNREPLASASIGQVHRATLKDGREVAVKVQRPDIDETINVDLEILHNMARLAENNIKQFRYLNPTGIVTEFERSIREELDYNRERLNLERFCKMFEHDSTVFVPKACKEYSNKRIFTMEYIEGTKISRISAEDLEGFDRKRIAYQGAELMLKQIFVHGFFHADPHPGNLWVLDNNRLCFLDFGMMGTVTPNQQNELGALMIALVRRDSSMITTLLLEITKYPDHPLVAEIEFEVNSMLNRYIDLPLEELDTAGILEELIKLLSRFKLKVPANLVMMAKSIIMIEGVGRQLYPQFQISLVIDSFSSTILRRKLNPKKFIEDNLLSFTEYHKLVHEFPVDLRAIMHKMKRGNFKMEIENKSGEQLQTTLDSVSYRLVFGLVLAALIVGSSIMVHVESPRWDVIPLVGIAGFVLGSAFALLTFIVSVVRTFRRR